MLSCAEFLEEFGDYLDEAASPELRARLEGHLHECQTCRVIVDSSQKTIKIITDHETFTLPAGDVEPLVGQVMAKIRRKEARNP